MPRSPNIIHGRLQIESEQTYRHIQKPMEIPMPGGFQCTRTSHHDVNVYSACTQKYEPHWIDNADTAESSNISGSSHVLSRTHANLYKASFPFSRLYGTPRSLVLQRTQESETLICEMVPWERDCCHFSGPTFCFRISVKKCADPSANERA